MQMGKQNRDSGRMADGYRSMTAGANAIDSRRGSSV